MSGFAAEWLALREPADRQARDASLLRRAADWLTEGGGRATVLDLGCGSGSTLAALQPLLASASTVWRLLDDDPVLLAFAMERAEQLGAEAETRLADLSDVAAIPLEGVRLATASALFDLASRDFIEAIAERLTAASVGLYAALNYDGSTVFSPSHPLDGIVLAGFNRHQLRPKGLGSGASLGPAAARALARALEARGYAVTIAESPWRLASEDAALARAHVEGMADAVGELDVIDAEELEAWRQMRIDSAAGGRTIVGHLDILALPD
ncbi:class I SAM-dependent methyltransferase [Jiella endophytica]|uniref:Class I SAM-dependent methyltransferase n=1 Tax=Jiella endophytica TaxID=2558362 RepID=A0A4Y8RJU3_9HYPH|nr:class I SAM-dependent methyltransferase [Jiella endophytica]TFF23002.1 class I SAM-dependent methyltransferase [Jiella endophytica]